MTVAMSGKGIANGRESGWMGWAMLALAAAMLAPAADAQEPEQQPGPPVNVARLSYVSGKVQIAQGSQVMADQAPVNAPLLAGTTLTTGQDGQAEVEFAEGSVARLSPNSSLTLASLPAGQSSGEIVANSGLSYFELESGSISVHFSDAVATVAGSTVFRIDMDTPPGNLAVFSGNVHLERGDAMDLDMHGGESVALSAGDPTQFNLAETIQPDSWDQWNSDRDQAMAAESADQSGPPGANPAGDTPAWNDLAANGNWYNVPDEGTVWSPYEASDAGWDPYGSGSWVYTVGYGYTWASSEPWGFLPYQCGAWNYYDGFGWGWSPGLMGGCGAGFWLGRYPGAHVIRGPVGYPPIHPPSGRGPGGHEPHPVIAVNRHFASASEPLPARDRNTAVQIDGATVMPMRTQGLRQAYNSGGGFSGGMMGQGRVAPSTPGQERPAYNATGGYAPAGGNNRPVYTPPAAAFRNPNNANYLPPGRGNTYVPPSRTYAPVNRPPGGGYAPPPPPSRPPGGGGGARGGSAHH